MIKITAPQRFVRETTAPFIYAVEDGTEQTKDIRVQYYSSTWNEVQEQHASLAAKVADDPTQTIWPHETFAKRVHALPDLADAKGKPFAITAENLGMLDIRNLDAMKKAIDEDIAGK